MEGLDVLFRNDPHLGKDVGYSDHMVGDKAYDKNHQDHKSLYYNFGVHPLTVLLGFLQRDRTKPEGDLTIGIKEKEQQKEKKSHRHHIEYASIGASVLEMEALVVTGATSTSVQKEAKHGGEADRPHHQGCGRAERLSVYSELLKGLDDFEVAVQADQAEKQNADVHGDVEDHAYHLTESRGTTVVLISHPEGQTEREQEIGNGKVLHVHRDGVCLQGAQSEDPERQEVAKETNDGDDGVHCR